MHLLTKGQGKQAAELRIMTLAIIVLTTIIACIVTFWLSFRGVG